MKAILDPQPPHSPDLRSSPGGRMFSLDVLRGVAIVMVIFRHLPGPPQLQEMIGQIGGSVPMDSATGVFFELARRAGWAGVDLFFVLSGFLISGLLFKEFDATGRIRVARFWLRRGFKIWPSYFVAYGLMLLVTCLHELIRTKHFPVDAVLRSWPNWIFVQNYVPQERWPSSWSLAIEEHFYIALPLLLVMLGRLRTGPAARRFVALVPIGCLVALACLLGRTGADQWEQAYLPTHLRIDALLFGVVLGYLHRYHPAIPSALAKWWPAWLLLALGSLAIPMSLPLDTERFTWTVGFTILYLSLGSLVMVAGARPDAAALRASKLGVLARALAWMGVYSYTIYLFHAAAFHCSVVGSFRAHMLAQPWAGTWLDRIIFVTGAVLGGVLLSHAVERPFLRLRSKWL